MDASSSELSFHERVAKLAVEKFSQLPKRGKPTVNEWSPLAAVLVCRKDLVDISADLEVVALGTGSKCIGQGKMSKEGWIVNDSHAEVITRRCFRRYLLKQLRLAKDRKNSVFEIICEQKTFRLRNGVSFHFFTSQVPCGDAAIFPQMEPFPFVGDQSDPPGCMCKCPSSGGEKFDSPPPDPRSQPPMHSNKRRKLSDIDSCSIRGGRGLEGLIDVHRTGAKCVLGGPQDDKGQGFAYHTTGPLRTKPGRGDPTLSMSCSDKMMKWNVLGCQGTFLSTVLAGPVYFDSVTVSGRLFDDKAIQRALCGRLSLLENLKPIQDSGCSGGYKIHSPRIVHAEVPMPSELSYSEQKRLAPGAICWCVDPPMHEVIVQGLKQGANTRIKPGRDSSSSLCKQRWFEEFVSFASELKLIKFPPSFTYFSLKAETEPYQSIKKLFLDHFKTWIRNERTWEEFQLDKAVTSD